MSLLCFGAVGFVRAATALLPGYASRFAVHMFAACVGMLAGFAYLLLFGMSGSAVRAWLMVMLVLATWLLDRLGLALRNFGFAAFIVFLVSPLSLFTAGGRGVARSLPPYLADNAARLLAQPVHTDGDPTDGGSAGMRLHDRAAGGTLAIVTSQRQLTGGCRDGTPIVSLSGLPTGNYTLQITRGGITARAADGQYFRISPVSRPWTSTSPVWK